MLSWELIQKSLICLKIVRNLIKIRSISLMFRTESNDDETGIAKRASLPEHASIGDEVEAEAAEKVNRGIGKLAPNIDL